MKKYWLFHLSFTLLLTACNWKVFDDFEKQATIQVIEPPGNFVGTNFGQVVSGVLDKNGNVIPNVFLVGGNGTTPLAIVRVDETNGSVSRTACVSDEGIPVSSLTPLPATDDGRWRAIVSDGNYNSVHVVSFDPNEDKPHITIESQLSLSNEFFGIATLTGYFHNDQTLEVAVVSSHSLYFFNDTLREIQQQVDFASNFNFHVPAPQDAGTRIFVPFMRNNQLFLALGGQQINNTNHKTAWAVLLIKVNSNEIQILKGDWSLSKEKVCSLSAGQINEDFNDDLVVGICHSTLVFEATNSNDTWFNPTGSFQETGKMLGRIVSLMDINQDDTLELVISDPEQAIDSKRNGEVLFYNVKYNVKTTKELLRLQSPPDEKRFGSSLFSLQTRNGRHELVVGGANASYLFFLTRLFEDDTP